jgi:hypothetical protein
MNFLRSKNGKIAAVLVAVLLAVSGYLLFGGRAKTEPVPEVEEDEAVQSLSPEEVGLEIEANSAGNEVKFSLAKLDEMTALEYQIQYEADSTAQEISEGAEPRVDRGIIGTVELDSGETSYESEWIVLGSESAGTKRYDKGVEEIELTLKLTKSDGTVYRVEDSLKL